VNTLSLSLSLFLKVSIYIDGLQFVLPISISGYENAKVKCAIFKVGELVR